MDEGTQETVPREMLWRLGCLQSGWVQLRRAGPELWPLHPHSVRGRPWHGGGADLGKSGTGDHLWDRLYGRHGEHLSSSCIRDNVRGQRAERVPSSRESYALLGSKEACRPGL